MRRLRLLSALLTALGTAVVCGLFTGCEDTPSMGGLDRFFLEHPLVQDPRAAGSQVVAINPTIVTLAFKSQTVEFRANGGRTPYTWAVANSTRGTVTPAPGKAETATYAAVELAPNSVIAYDRNGNAAIANLAVGAAQPLTIVPDFVSLTNAPAGLVVKFQVSGGIPPYGQWAVSIPALGTIDANGTYTVGGSGIQGENVVTITDSEDDLDSAIVSHE